MDMVAWQRALRIQAGEEASFRMRNLGGHAIFSEFAVGNPAKGSTYRVAIRGEALGVNYCACADFATNRLGVCKHIAFVLHRLRHRPGAARQLQAGHTPPFSEIAVAYDGRPRLRLLVGGDCPPPLQRLAAQALSAHGDIDAAAIPRLLRVADRLGHEIRVYDDARDLMAAAADDRRRRQQLASAYPKGARDPKLARLLRGITLHPYQCEGAFFLASRGRALLADDMGLGKTAQAIAAARMLEREAGLKHILFVAPASLVGQWAEEIERFTGQAATIIRGLREVRQQAWIAERKGWTVATYDCLHRDLAAIQEWGVDLLILDEAQRIKNWPTRAAQAVRRIDCPSCFVLTGTPMENKLDELHALIEVVDRHLLGPLFAFKDRHTEHEAESGKVIGYHGLDHIAEAIAPVLLRRTRAQVMDQLPGRSVVVLREPLTPEQRDFHEEDQVAVATLVKRWRRQRFLSEVDQKRLMKHLQRMRMVCDDAYLLDHDRRAGPKLDQLTTVLEQELGDPATKVVIFSTWMAMHELIRGRIDERGWGYAFLHGGIPSIQRPELIRRFRDDDDCRVFLATDCGATGLNLQCATVLVNVDLPWNPAVREQRISRIHRQGQRRPVRIYDLIAEDGIEAGIAQLLTFKSELAAGVLDGGASSVRMEGSTLQRFMRTVAELDDTMQANAEAPVMPATDAGGSAASAGTGTPTPSIDGGADDSEQAMSPRIGRSTEEPAIALGSAMTMAAQLLADFGRLAATASIERNRATGASELRVPLPDPGMLASLKQSLTALHGILTAQAG